ncbi:peptidase M14 [Christiangramia salexigens]|uniref:Peptidase M14 n=2 Tax=Christiangramia salexigens TaxID=1913577 RepID=A0A1L3J3D6_9FLAO|nr:peptidase M14 [Christiangramia salexigens]
MEYNELEDWFSDIVYSDVKFGKITGRYVTNRDVDLFKDRLSEKLNTEVIGESVESKPIHSFKIGSGKIKILAWSQMHGNESTTTKAVFDLFNAFVNNSQDPLIKNILDHCTLHVIPVLNPDGADAYTRVNANSVDLNRDLQKLSQPESRVLKQVYRDFKPDFCLNLHDQRTIFSAGNKQSCASLSFLTPSSDDERSVNDFRKISMGLIAGMVKDLNEQLSEQIGRYDDGFNINCAGDTFQSMSTPTILFEAGHVAGDYEREETRKYVFRALISCIYRISLNYDLSKDYEGYFEIPENQKLYNDIIIRRAKLGGEIKDISLQFKEVLKNGKIIFQPVVEKIASQISNFAHWEIQAEENPVQIPGEPAIIENVVVNKIFLKNELLMLKS